MDEVTRIDTNRKVLIHSATHIDGHLPASLWDTVTVSHRTVSQTCKTLARMIRYCIALPSVHVWYVVPTRPSPLRRWFCWQHCSWLQVANNACFRTEQSTTVSPKAVLIVWHVLGLCVQNIATSIPASYRVITTIEFL